MRTERRQDLRTNELSQHLDAVRDYAKQNAALLTIIVVAAAILVGAGFAYAKWQNDRRMEAWDQVESADANTNATKAIDDLEAVAAKNLTPGLTAAALLKVAETALRQSAVPATEGADSLAAAAPAGKTVDWAAKAADAYNDVLNRFPNDVVACGQAMIALGVLAEGKGDFEKARSLYKKVADDKRFLHTALIAQADYRLAHLDKWSKPVVFPPPQMTVPIPEGKEAEAYTIPSEPDASKPGAGTPAAVTTPAQPSPVPPGTGSPQP
jgi:hypothetical protein